MDSEQRKKNPKPTKVTTDTPSTPSTPNTAVPPQLAHVESPAAHREPGWTFLSNHAHVLILLYRDPSLVLREVAWKVGITERAVQRIIADLEHAGYIEREKVGRKNAYRIPTQLPLRHPIEAHRTIGDLLALIQPES